MIYQRLAIEQQKKNERQSVKNLNKGQGDMRITFPQNDLAVKNMKRIKSANKAAGKPQNQNLMLDRRNRNNFNST